MNSKPSGSNTALRRLMTEYRQLTSGGIRPRYRSEIVLSAFQQQVLLMGCLLPAQSPNLISLPGKRSSVARRTHPLYAPLIRVTRVTWRLSLTPLDCFIRSQEGGVFAAKLTFPPDYPLSPFKMKFEPPLFHPNVYADGTVCISILHTPGDDPTMYELASERWSPVQSVEKVILSVISMLAEPNLESGANIDCCKLYRENKKEYERIVCDSVKQQLGL
ncbi:hypothetical protein AX15_006872 [Amanita polypyramis BW_CC]|nr:hypothetical protein AX15_006872 [Amanita polypyramis BW_CC]